MRIPSKCRLFFFLFQPPVLFLPLPLVFANEHAASPLDRRAVYVNARVVRAYPRERPRQPTASARAVPGSAGLRFGAGRHVHAGEVVQCVHLKIHINRNSCPLPREHARPHRHTTIAVFPPDSAAAWVKSQPLCGAERCDMVRADCDSRGRAPCKEAHAFRSVIKASSATASLHPISPNLLQPKSARLLHSVARPRFDAFARSSQSP